MSNLRMGLGTDGAIWRRMLPCKKNVSTQTPFETRNGIQNLSRGDSWWPFSPFLLMKGASTRASTSILESDRLEDGYNTLCVDGCKQKSELDAND